MSKHQLMDTLYKIFKEENQRIVFWYDADREFEEGLADLKLDGVNLLRLHEIGSLEVKVLLELQDTTGRYLLYAPFPEPAVKDDWLLDVRLYSRTFHADLVCRTRAGWTLNLSGQSKRRNGIFFAGKVVRKDLTKLVKEGANVPVYVLEYLLGMYCASDNEEVIQDGLKNVKKILAENYVRPDESEKIKSKIRELGTYKVIDKITVKLNEKRDCYEALLSNLGVKGVEIASGTVKKYEKLLVGGIWCIVTLNYFYEENMKGSPFSIGDLKPIQMPNMDMDGLFEGRKAFTQDQWMDVLVRSTGMEPSVLEPRVKWHLIARMIPFVENGYNVCELGPRGTGKSHIYKEISPNSILVSGGQTTVANLFYKVLRV